MRVCVRFGNAKIREVVPCYGRISSKVPNFDLLVRQSSEMEEQPRKRRRPLQPAASDALGTMHLADRLDGLAGMAWAYAVLHYSGMSARAAGIHFTPPEHLITDRAGHTADSGLFNHYLRGQRKPIAGARGKNGVDLVAAVGQETYGRRANVWLDHPLWRIFARSVSQEGLAIFLGEGNIPLQIVPYLFRDDFSEIPAEQAPRITKSGDFLYVCAFYRQMHIGGYPSAMVPLLRYLVPQVCSLDPVFGYIYAPFVRMLEEYFFKTDEQIAAACPVDVPPCVDPEFSDILLPDDGPCPLSGKGKTKHVCERCEGGGGGSVPELDWCI